MTPHLVKWHNKYLTQGLVIVDVDHGGIDKLDAVRDHVRSDTLPFAVLHDAGGATCSRYGVMGFPTAYLIDRNGRTIWKGFPAGNPSAAEKLIEAALAESGS